jgi:hypothetical protein
MRVHIPIQSGLDRLVPPPDVSLLPPETMP